MHTFFLPPQDWPAVTPSAVSQGSVTVTLDGGEARHLLRVLRLRPGEEAILLDGRGREALCRLDRVEKHSAYLLLLNLVQHPLPGSRIILAAGWGKAARRGWILEKAVELEAAGLWFWQAERSQFALPETIRAAWQAQLVAGAKQCRNPWLPELRVLPGGAADLLRAAACADHKQLLVESDHPHQDFLSADRLGQPGCTLCVVGPEGGFTSAEAALFTAAGFTALSMGSRVLRWETAAVMALGLHWWKRQQPSQRREA
jgi:16S rRNA (uracil1498-N3)-methyltransferase